MTTSELLTALASAVVFGRGDKPQDDDEHDDDAPLAAEADNGGTVEVNGTWPRRSDARVELLTSTIAAVTREEDIKVARLRAMVSDALEARNARLQALHEVDQAVRAQLCADIDREVTAALHTSWPAYRASGSLVDASAVGGALAQGHAREMVELGGDNLSVTSGALVRIVWADRPGTASDALLNACWRAVTASRSGSAILLTRALGDVESLSALTLS